MGTGIYVYDGCTVESVGSTRAMDIFSGRAPLVEHSRKIIWLVEEASGVITGLSPVPIDEKGYARQDLVMHRILIIMNNEDIAEGWPADDLQARRYVDAMRSPPPPAVLWGKIRNLKAARPRLQTG